MSSNNPNILVRLVLSSLFAGEGREKKRQRNFPKVTQLVRGRAETGMQSSSGACAQKAAAAFCWSCWNVIIYIYTYIHIHIYTYIFMDCSTPGFPVLHYLPEFAQTHVHWFDDGISSSVAPFSSCPQSFPALGSFPMNWLFASGDHSIGASASVSVLPMNIQDWFHLGLTDLIS